MRRAGIEKRSEMRDRVRRLVVSKENRPAASAIWIRVEEDVHLGPSSMVADVAPVRIADVPETVGSTSAYVRVRQSHCGRVVGRRECERAYRAARREKLLNLRGREPRTQHRRSGFLEQPAS